MQKRVTTIIHLFILAGIVLGLILILMNLFKNPINEKEESKECIDINNVASFIHSTCYDAYTKEILMELKRTYDAYNVKSISLSFFDLSDKSYEITSVPKINETKKYRVPAEKNPESLNFKLNIIKDFSSEICSEPRVFFIKYCPPGTNKDLEVNLGKEEEKSGYIQLGNRTLDDSDLLNEKLVDKERIWKSKCESQWQCSGWESCINGVQRRECIDTKNCFIPTDTPDFTKTCDGSCNEMWECIWSECENGFTTPSCKDLNKCGTKFNIPQKLSCRGEKSSCVPDIECSEWTECKSDYEFSDILGGVKNLNGEKSRTCFDKNGCMQKSYETANCSLRIDIYTQRIRKCGIEYLAIYNKLTNQLIAKIEQGKNKNSAVLNIQLTDSESEYCDYCFDGIKNGDEEQIDCGGSCEPCYEKQYITPYQKQGILTKIENWIKRIISTEPI